MSDPTTPAVKGTQPLTKAERDRVQADVEHRTWGEGSVDDAFRRYEATVAELEARCAALEADREALIAGSVRAIYDDDWRVMNTETGLAADPRSFATADEALQAYHASRSRTPTTSTTIWRRAMSDPQPQRPVSEAPKACLFSIVEGGREVFRVTPDGTQTLADDATPAELRAAIHYLGQAFHEAWNRRAVSEAPAALKVTRLTVVDHRLNGIGRAHEMSNVAVELSYQDDGRTLKVFVSDRPSTPSSAPTTTCFVCGSTIDVIERLVHGKRIPECDRCTRTRWNTPSPDPSHD